MTSRPASSCSMAPPPPGSRHSLSFSSLTAPCCRVRVSAAIRRRTATYCAALPLRPKGCIDWRPRFKRIRKLHYRPRNAAIRATMRLCSAARSVPGGSSQTDRPLRRPGSPGPSACRAGGREMRRRGHGLDLGGRQMGGEPAPRCAEIGRRQPGLTRPEADQQHPLHQVARMVTAEPVGQRGVDGGYGADAVVLAAGIPFPSE